MVESQPLQPGFEAFMRAWGRRPNPPTITMAFVRGLARPEYLVEMDALAVVAESGQTRKIMHYGYVAD